MHTKGPSPPKCNPRLPLCPTLTHRYPCERSSTLPPKGLDTLGLFTLEETDPEGISLQQAALICFKGLRKATRLPIRHARNLKRLKYGKSRLRIFVKKPIVALKSILRTSTGPSDTPSLPTDLYILRDKESGLLTTPSDVIQRFTQMETITLSPDPTLPPGTPFPWLGHVRPTPTSSVPMLIGQITPDIYQEALRRTPNHKAGGSDGVPGLVLKYTLPAYHEALEILFHAMAIMKITPPSWLKSHTIILYKKVDPMRLDNYRPITLANVLYKL
jgi:hypothetical protein